MRIHPNHRAVKGLPPPRGKQTRHNDQPEFLAQSALFEWARLPATVTGLPGIELMSSSLNGVRLSKAQAGKAKAAGMLKGEWDIRLPVPRGSHVGLLIEMKIKPNKPTDEQIWYGDEMRREGWATFVCYEWTDAVRVITHYLSQPRPTITPCTR